MFFFALSVLALSEFYQYPSGFFEKTAVFVRTGTYISEKNFQNVNIEVRNLNEHMKRKILYFFEKILE
jgi:hypothetical protein